MGREDELTPGEVAAVFRKIGKLDVVRISGGEPFLRDDLLEISEAILRAARPFAIHITTNGSLPERVVELVRRFSSPAVLRFMVSFDGLAEEHDRNRGKRVTFARALDTVRRLAPLRRRYGLEISANHTVISPRSLADNAALREQIGRHGVEVHSVLAYADSAMYGADLRNTRAEHLVVPQGYPLHPDLAGADVVGFVRDELARANHYRDPMLRCGKRYYLSGLLARLRGEPGATVRPRCVALRSHIRLLPDGSVPICQFNTEQIGNLRHASFEQVWHNPDAQSARRWVDACPGCWAECEVLPNAIYSGDLLRFWAAGAQPQRDPPRERVRA